MEDDAANTARSVSSRLNNFNDISCLPSSLPGSVADLVLVRSMPRVEEIKVRRFSRRRQYELILYYFYKADDPFLRGMGVDRLKLPERNKWLEALLADHEKPAGERDRFYLVWIFRGTRVGHSSINKIVLGDKAFIHLHLWNSQLRRAGLGTEFVRRSASF